ncbi:hypothetical protein CBR_g40023 [Chara braunii]|uniref:Uncharacterized protein n=1 Tax=Chara braunii TaxID=69332 RepID=A0A388LSS8_CHABU|nr:hypothetical protein CBR_g40023 [Chara braunii]|eukprot:GBG85380.1 hypothetical protein CBR_g40023 [Chara braunii]
MAAAAAAAGVTIRPSLDDRSDATRPSVSTVPGQHAQLRTAALTCSSTCRALNGSRTRSFASTCRWLRTRRRVVRSQLRRRQQEGELWGSSLHEEGTGSRPVLLPRQPRAGGGGGVYHSPQGYDMSHQDEDNHSNRSSSSRRRTGEGGEERRARAGWASASLAVGEQGRESSDATSEEGQEGERGGGSEPSISGKGLADMRWTRMAFFWKRSKPYEGRVGTFMKEGNVAMAAWGLKSRSFRQPPNTDRAKALSALLPYVVVATAVSALVYPPSYSWFSKQYYTPALGGIMLSIGIQLKPSDFLLAIARPKPVLLGYGVQYIIKVILCRVFKRG